MKIARAAAFVSLPGLTLLAASVLLISLPDQAQSAPKPARVSPEWMLELSYHQPEAIAVQEQDGRVRWFWYLAYEVTNETGEPRTFIPDVTVAYDNGAIINADKGVPSRVYNVVQQRVGNPLLKTPPEIAGDLLEGEDYARAAVAVWEHPDETEHGPANEMRVFVAGISGETEAIPHPTEPDETIVLHRTRMLRYAMPGRPRTPRHQPLVFEGAEDVMR